MKQRTRLIATLLILLIPPGAAQLGGSETFTEDFESFNLGGFEPELKPDQDWYNYVDVTDIGDVSTDPPTIAGTQSLRVQSPAGLSTGDKWVAFDLEIPAALTSTTLFVEGVTISDDGDGSNQVISIQSSAPRRTMAEFYVFCDKASSPNGCELRVRFEEVDSTGQTLIAATQNQTQFKIHVEPNWFNGTYQLFVDDIDDGTFPFLQLPSNIGRIQIAQHSASSPLNTTFDDWTITGAFAGQASTVEGDAATGIKNFLININFTSEGSKLLMGILFYVVLLASVIAPLLSLGKDNTVVPAIGFYGMLCALWLIQMEVWPDWIGITMIILASALISLAVRRLILGMRDVSTGPSLVAGSLGYFIIASSLLAFSGYAGEDVFLPTADLSVDEEAVDALPANETVEQSFGAAVVDCGIGIISFGQLGDCTRRTEGTAIKWAKDTIDSVARITATIFAYGRAAVEYLFQLLTFQLPIPVVFNMMIVLPPASALATLAIQTIRGSS